MDKNKPISEITTAEWLSMEEEREKRLRPIFKIRFEKLGESILNTAEVCKNTGADVDSNLLPILSIYKDTFVEYLISSDYMKIQDCKEILSIFDSKPLINVIGVDSLIFNFRDLHRILESVKSDFEIKLIDQETKVELFGIDSNLEQEFQKGNSIMIGDRNLEYGAVVKFLNYNTPILSSIKKGKIKKHIKLLDQLLIEVKSRISWFQYLKNQQKIGGQVLGDTQGVKEQRGFDLGLDEEQLKTLYKELTDKKFLSKNTSVEEHFINAFNGEVLKDFGRLKWQKSKVILTMFIGAIDSFKEQEDKWQKTQLVFKDVDADNLRKTYSN